MSQCNSEGVAEFIRLIEELRDFIDDMNGYEKTFMYDQSDRAERFGDKLRVTETQLEFARKLYAEYL